jgi:hypothetical protein
MARYATGKHALGSCDRCGWNFRLNALKELIVNEAKTNLLVCAACFDKDHPQYLVGKLPVEDPQALQNPRPDKAEGDY